nr:MAG TPA: hypothetical protein [Caudoviricetes sp.]
MIHSRGLSAYSWICNRDGRIYRRSRSSREDRV